MIYIICAAIIGAFLAFGYVLSTYIRSSHALERVRSDQAHELRLREVEASKLMITAKNEQTRHVSTLDARAVAAQIEYHSNQSQLASQVIEAVQHDKTMKDPARIRYMEAAVRQLDAIAPISGGDERWWNKDGSPKGIAS